MKGIRRQLTLFIKPPEGTIEKIRARYNPKQYHLIPAHVTLCKEDEIEPIVKTIERLATITLEAPLRIRFVQIERFAAGKGVFIPSTEEYKAFQELRKLVLGQTELIREQVPHITLMHPRNSTCDDKTFEQLKRYDLPSELEFDTICLIEQIDGGVWTVLQEFKIVRNKAE